MRIELKIVIITAVISIITIGIIVMSIFLTNSNRNVILTSLKSDSNKENFIKIRYAYDYNVSEADTLNKNSKDGKHINILEINLEGENLEKIKNLLKKQSYKEIDNVKIAVLDVYEVNINNEITLSIQPRIEYAICNKENERFLIDVSKELVDEINRIVQEKAGENIR